LCVLKFKAISLTTHRNYVITAINKVPPTIRNRQRSTINNHIATEVTSVFQSQIQRNWNNYVLTSFFAHKILHKHYFA